MKNAYAHGIGRHSEEEMYKIMCDDLKALSDFIGKFVPSILIDEFFLCLLE